MAIDNNITARNTPYKTEIAYRSDDFSSLRYKLLLEMRKNFPQWNGDPDNIDGEGDFARVFIEAFAYMSEILGFYQDLRASESFLRTAQLPESVLELCRLINYAPATGAAASSLQVFLLKEGESGVIPAGYQLKTKAARGKPAFVFETQQLLNAAAARNKLFISDYDRSARRINDPVLQNHAVLQQIYDNIKAGDYTVFSDASDPDDVQHHPVLLTAVVEQDDKTEINWPATLLTQQIPIADLTILGYPMQKMVLADKERADEITLGWTRARLSNAAPFTLDSVILFESEGLRQAARIIAVPTVSGYITWSRGFPVSLRKSTTKVYKAINIGHTVNLIRRGALKVVRNVGAATAQAGDLILIVDGSGVEIATVAGVSGYTIYFAEPLLRNFSPLLQQPTSGHATVQLYRVRLPDAAAGVTSDNAVSNIAPDILPAGTTTLILNKTYKELESGRLLVMTDGAQQQVVAIDQANINDAKQSVITLVQPTGQPFAIARLQISGPFRETMYVDGYNRSEASTQTGATSLTLNQPLSDLKPGDYLAISDPQHAEGMRVKVVSISGSGTTVSLDSALQYSYALADATVYANVIPVTHGESVVEEILGSGDASMANQQFLLQKSPLTFLHDAEGYRGIGASLEVYVDGRRWQQVEHLADSRPDDRHYVIEIDAEQRVRFTFGDNHYGAAVATGRDNVRARYRVGLGAGANVEAGRIIDAVKPLKYVQSTFNVVRAAGGADADTLENNKRLAPTTVRTFDRAVSLHDYADLTLGYAGIAKARCDWEWRDGKRVIVLTVAATGGESLTSQLAADLRQYLDRRRSPHHRLIIRDYQPLPVYLEIEIQVLPDFLQAETKLRVEQALGDDADEMGNAAYFNFNQRGLGRDLFLSDIYKLVENLRGVDSLLVKAFALQQAAGPVHALLDRISIDPFCIATGGHASDMAQGVLVVRARGGIA